MIRIPDTSQQIQSSAEMENGVVYLTSGIKDPRNNYRKDLCPIGPDEFLMSYSHKVFHIRNGLIIGERSFSTDIIDVFAARNGDFWVGLEREGALRFPGGDFTMEPHRHLKGETVTGITQDHEGSYWFSTGNSGIFQAITLDISVFNIPSNNPKDNVITSMTSAGDNVYLGTMSGLVLKGRELYNGSYHFQRIPLPLADGILRKIFWTPENSLIVINNFLQEVDTTGRHTGIRLKRAYPLEYLRKKNGEWIFTYTSKLEVGKGNRILRTWNDTAMRVKYPDDPEIHAALYRVRTLYEDTSQRIWAGSQQAGLFTIDGHKVYPWSRRDTLFGRRIQDIVQAGQNMWVSISDYGLAIIRPDSTIIRITQKEGLSSDIIDVLFAENDTIVWAGTNNGLNRITIDPAARGPVKIDYYTMREGLPSNRIYQIIKHKDKIWLGTTQGAIRLNPEFTRAPSIMPKLNAGPLLVNGIARNMKDSLILGPNENNLVIKFKAITYRKPVPITYHYRLIGIDKNYVVTDVPEARYPDLGHGKYTFCINASYNSEFDPAFEQRYQLVIRKHLSDTTLFKILVLTAALLLLIAIFRMILRASKAREEEKRKLLQAEKRSLLSQMNPHFIFNSLNSIQHYIVQNDQLQANNFLSNFSGLIRRILDNSKKNLIPLNEEITTLSLYLSMEDLRFEGGFTYQILKDTRIDYNETMIPPMLLQPFVENAIWHGLMPSKSPGKLTISFEYQEGYVRCTVEDNGIGRRKAATIRGSREPHTSSGIRNIEERIDLLNKITRKKFRLKVTDLYLPNSEACGTLIELIIPNDLSQ
jgi:hypothetical protein